MQPGHLLHFVRNIAPSLMSRKMPFT